MPIAHQKRLCSVREVIALCGSVGRGSAQQPCPGRQAAHDCSENENDAKVQEVADGNVSRAMHKLGKLISMTLGHVHVRKEDEEIHILGK